MPLLFPIAKDALSALAAAAEPDAPTARTLAEARRLAGAEVSLVSDWLRPDEAQHAALKPNLDAAAALGFAQLYEDAKGRPVAAVAYWKPATTSTSRDSPAPAGEDHTDDLYFDRQSGRQSGLGRERSLRLRARRGEDANQLDLFAGAPSPEAQTPKA